MKSLQQLLILFFFFVSACSLRGETNLEHSPDKNTLTQYTVRIDRLKSPVAYVSVSFVLGDSELYMAPGANHLPKRWATFVSNISATNSSGEKLKITPQDDGTWITDGNPGEQIFLKYQLNLEHDKHQWSSGIDGAAYTTDHSYFFTGRSLWVLNGQNRENISVIFDIPQSWQVSVPWHKQGDEKFKFEVTSHEELTQSILCLGKQHSTILHRDGFELEFVLGQGQITKDTTTYIQMANKVLDYYINLMGGVPSPPPGQKLKKALVVINDGTQTDGEVIGNHISILIGNTNDPQDQMLSKFIFAHEFFHLWNGKSFRPDDNSMEWFKEGFSNYYTLKALYRTGFLNEESYLSVLNSLFYNRYIYDDGLGKIALTNGDAKHDHWGIIYAGGLFIAMAQDMIIRNETNNKESIDTLMKHLYQKYGGTDGTYSMDELLLKLNELSGSDQTQFFKDFVYGAKIIPVEKYISRSAFEASVENESLKVVRKKSATPLENSISNSFLGVKH